MSMWWMISLLYYFSFYDGGVYGLDGVSVKETKATQE